MTPPLSNNTSKAPHGATGETGVRDSESPARPRWHGRGKPDYKKGRVGRVGTSGNESFENGPSAGGSGWVQRRAHLPHPSAKIPISQLGCQAGRIHPRRHHPLNEQRLQERLRAVGSRAVLVGVRSLAELGDATVFSAPRSALTPSRPSPPARTPSSSETPWGWGIRSPSMCRHPDGATALEPRRPDSSCAPLKCLYLASRVRLRCPVLRRARWHSAA